MARIKINNNYYDVRDDLTILEACHEIGIKIPTLCYLKGISEESSCRMCVVEVVGNKALVASCTTRVWDKMEILTNSPKVLSSRKETLSLILANHNKSCLTCEKSGHCELQRLTELYDINLSLYENKDIEVVVDDHNHCIVRDNSKCILCNRCVNFCKNIQGVEAIKRINRGIETYIGSFHHDTLDKTKCVYCGGCVSVCPTGALREKDSLTQTIEALNNPKLHVVACYAPAVRVAFGEEFGYTYGTNVAGKINTALTLTGFEKVFDVSYGADVTIIEEAHELKDRLSSKKHLPLLTSCCPAWVNYIKNFYPEYLENLSSTKSPQQIMGSLIKSYYSEKEGINPKNIFLVSIMPCIAKKEESKTRNNNILPDIDCVLTTRELVKLIKLSGLDFQKLKPSSFSNLLGKGNSVIFGTSGGVMESALRYLKEDLDGKQNDELIFREVRGMKGVKESNYEIKGQKIRALVISGLGNVKKLLETGKIKNYDFVEVMACPGGCINGGGQPYIDGYTRSFINYQNKRSKGLYGIEKNYKSNKARDNTSVKKLYKEYLGKPLGEKSHKILHYHFKVEDK